LCLGTLGEEGGRGHCRGGGGEGCGLPAPQLLSPLPCSVPRSLECPNRCDALDLRLNPISFACFALEGTRYSTHAHKHMQGHTHRHTHETITSHRSPCVTRWHTVAGGDRRPDTVRGVFVRCDLATLLPRSFAVHRKCGNVASGASTHCDTSRALGGRPRRNAGVRPPVASRDRLSQSRVRCLGPQWESSMSLGRIGRMRGSAIRVSHVFEYPAHYACQNVGIGHAARYLRTHIPLGAPTPGCDRFRKPPARISSWG
jgi:hypothetical protein